MKHMTKKSINGLPDILSLKIVNLKTLALKSLIILERSCCKNIIVEQSFNS